jgi:hypothetical protein
MKKSKLFTPVTFDFQLLGIVSNIQDHQLAWNLNQTQYFDFERLEDIVIEFNDRSTISIGCFKCSSDFHSYYLLKNKLHFTNHKSFNILLPELPQFDFFLKINNEVDDFDYEALISSVRDLQVIDYLVRLNTNQIKHKENLLF